MRIGFDIMGGDFAPTASIQGLLKVLPELAAEETVVLIGPETVIKEALVLQGADPSRFDIVHAPEIIEMGEHPTKALAQKPNSSISVGFQLLKEGKIDAFASAGNTGAMMVGALFSVKTIEGISRPCISTILPKINGKVGVLLDVGANADVKPEHLNQFALLGSVYAESVLQIAKPKIGLLNLGEEEGKGTIVLQGAYPLLKENKHLHFAGNIEGRDLFNDKADVIVCDGYVGNVVLKLCENFYELLLQQNIKNDYFDRYNYEMYGGMPILGVNAPVIIGHGISNALAFKNMLLQARGMVLSGLVDKIKNKLV
jgi:glycerol-3-phosphate acyltransferase PlsX